MSYAIRLAGDAVADLRALDPAIAEQVLDELDALGAEPSRLRMDLSGEAVHDFELRHGGTRHIFSSDCIGMMRTV